MTNNNRLSRHVTFDVDENNNIRTNNIQEEEFYTRQLHALGPQPINEIQFRDNTTHSKLLRATLAFLVILFAVIAIIYFTIKTRFDNERKKMVLTNTLYLQNYTANIQ